jgi:hypothetical protein
MATAPIPLYSPPALPDYLPARMVNEFVYCPRLFFYEWVECVFRESVDTIEGQAQHRRVDRETKGMPLASDLGDEKIHTRSVTLSSEKLRVIAKMDVIEIEDGMVTPVDYKHGRPREKDDALELWPTGPRSTHGSRTHFARERIPLRRGRCVLCQHEAAGSRGIRRSGDRRSGKGNL